MTPCEDKPLDTRQKRLSGQTAAQGPWREPMELSDPACSLLGMDWKIEYVAIPVIDAEGAYAFYVVGQVVADAGRPGGT